jgi:hypothetical protein
METLGELMERKLNTYLSVTRCLTQHMGMNTYAPFRNCSGCTNDELCYQMLAPCRQNFITSMKRWGDGRFLLRTKQVV